MSTKTELELRPLEARELEIVSGGGIPVQTEATIIGWSPFHGGPFQRDAVLYTGIMWNWYSANVWRGAHLSLPAGLR